MTMKDIGGRYFHNEDIERTVREHLDEASLAHAAVKKLLKKVEPLLPILAVDYVQEMRNELERASQQQEYAEHKLKVASERHAELVGRVQGGES